MLHWVVGGCPAMYLARTPRSNLENNTICLLHRSASSADSSKCCNFVLFQNISSARSTRKQNQFERALNGGTGMSDEKPMTVKERMAALARANSAPSAGPPKPGVASSGTSVADRLAKMRQGGSSPQGNSHHPVRSEGGGSSIADRIAKLSGNNNELGSGTTKPAADVSTGNTTTKPRQVFKSAGSSPADGGNNSVKAGGGIGHSPKPGGVGMPGMARAIPLPMPGAMPAGGLAELKRRKQEAEKAASGGTEEESTAPTAVAGKPAEDERPGELQHANLSRATIPQRRRPRKATRPFKATATSAAVKAPRPATVAAAAAPPTEQPPSISIYESQAVPPTKKTDASTEFSSTNAVDAVGKMKSMLQAAAKAEKLEDVDDDDADWE